MPGSTAGTYSVGIRFWRTFYYRYSAKYCQRVIYLGDYSRFCSKKNCIRVSITTHHGFAVFLLQLLRNQIAFGCKKRAQGSLDWSFSFAMPCSRTDYSANSSDAQLHVSSLHNQAIAHAMWPRGWTPHVQQYAGAQNAKATRRGYLVLWMLKLCGSKI